MRVLTWCAALQRGLPGAGQKVEVFAGVQRDANRRLVGQPQLVRPLRMHRLVDLWAEDEQKDRQVQPLERLTSGGWGVLFPQRQVREARFRPPSV